MSASNNPVDALDAELRLEDDARATEDGHSRYRLPNPPARISSSDLPEIFAFAEAAGFSDLHVRTGMAPYIKVKLRLYKLVERALIQSEVEEFLNTIYGANGSAEVMSGRPLDFAYEARPERGVRYRYRVNAKACYVEGGRGIKLSIRAISSRPPSIDKLGLEPEIMDAFSPNQGVVLVTGPTGSGKSTLLAAGIRSLIEEPGANRIITTYESPIEYTYESLNAHGVVVSQSEIGRDLPTFAAGVRNAMREDPDIILVGEARDAETVEAVVEASMTGHLVYSTVHSRGVAETVRRLFARLNKDSGITEPDILDALRLVVSQRLIPRLGGGVVALREFLAFTPAIREQLLDTPALEIPSTVRRLVEAHGKSLAMDAKIKYDAGLIDAYQLKLFMG